MRCLSSDEGDLCLRATLSSLEELRLRCLSSRVTGTFHSATLPSISRDNVLSLSSSTMSFCLTRVTSPSYTSYFFRAYARSPAPPFRPLFNGFLASNRSLFFRRASRTALSSLFPSDVRGFLCRARPLRTTLPSFMNVILLGLALPPSSFFTHSVIRRVTPVRTWPIMTCAIITLLTLLTDPFLSITFFATSINTVIPHDSFFSFLVGFIILLIRLCFLWGQRIRGSRSLATTCCNIFFVCWWAAIFFSTFVISFTSLLITLLVSYWAFTLWSTTERKILALAFMQGTIVFKPWRTRYESVNYGISNYWFCHLGVLFLTMWINSR